jgi:hypothetical protein
MTEKRLTPRPLASFFSTISSRRRTLKLSDAQLARRAAMPLETIGLLQKGSFVPSPSQAFRLGVALQLVDPAEFAEKAMCLLLLHPQYLLDHFDAGTA